MSTQLATTSTVPPQAAGKYLTFTIQRESYGIDVLKVREIIRLTDITAVPQMPEYVKGVINLRGKIVSVMDLRKRFGEKHTNLTKQNRILVVEHSGRLAGLIVDSASEVLKIPAEDVEPAPAVFPCERLAPCSVSRARGLCISNVYIFIYLDVWILICVFS